MNTKSIILLFCISLSIGIADFITTLYGLSIGLVESDGLYFPFLSTLVFFSMGLFADYLVIKTNSVQFNYVAISTLSVLGSFMIMPIINNLSLII